MEGRWADNRAKKSDARRLRQEKAYAVDESIYLDRTVPDAKVSVCEGISCPNHPESSHTGVIAVLNEGGYVVAHRCNRVTFTASFLDQQPVALKEGWLTPFDEAAHVKSSISDYRMRRDSGQYGDDEILVPSESAELFTDLEQEVCDLYEQVWLFQGVPAEDVHDLSVKYMQQAIEEAKADRMYSLPLNLGDVVLDRLAVNDPIVAERVATLVEEMDAKRADGMSDSDFREYWNAPEVTRRMQAIALSVNRALLLQHVVETEGPWDSVDDAFAAATAVVKARHATYAHPSDSDDRSDPHRPLPFEVESAVVRLNVFEADDLSLLARLDAAGTVNAYYRASLAN